MGITSPQERRTEDGRSVVPPVFPRVSICYIARNTQDLAGCAACSRVWKQIPEEDVSSFFPPHQYHLQGRFERWGRGRYGGIRYGFRRARSRLYRSQILQVNTRWKALAEIYTMHSFAPFWNLKFFVKNRQNFFAIELMNIH